VYDIVVSPFVEFGFLRRALVGCLALSVSAPVLGVFLVLRRMSLTADVLAHGALPPIETSATPSPSATRYSAVSVASSRPPVARAAGPGTWCSRGLWW
jgi:ABC-type Mn2+/Zn2+ transport system permease subunit